MVNRRYRWRRSLVPGPSLELVEGRLSTGCGGSTTLEVFGGPAGSVAEVVVDGRTVASIDLDAVGSGKVTVLTPSTGGAVTVLVGDVVLLTGGRSERRGRVES